MSVLAHVFEAAGIATVTLASTRSVAQRVAPPRALWCGFPLGRPLGRPGDPAFQHDVLRRAFALLDAPTGPVLVDHPEIIEADETPFTCQIPAAYDPDASEAITEVRGLRKAYERSITKRGVTQVGRAVDADGIEDAVRALERIAAGTPWREANIPDGNTTAVVHDIRSYYEEASLELVSGPPPEGRAAEAWFYETTQTGGVVMAARNQIREQGASFPVWFYMAPGHR